MPVVILTRLLLPVLVAAGLALAGYAGPPAQDPAVWRMAADAQVGMHDEGELPESGETLADASPDLRGGRGACLGPGPVEEPAHVGRDLPRPFSMARDRPRVRLPDRAADLHPIRSAPRPLTSVRLDRLPLTGGLA